ncbi:hypothetical protein NIES4071_102580 (plasmid) [Calothrix sp. NIES-4071]|nr:hypothetical protein NIES4071_102580 [Calothrix sp. NIES-4071]BAZ64639.1 hypothetical protein NIES4105_103720 [Calothrix sp. NIES-4105]
MKPIKEAATVTQTLSTDAMVPVSDTGSEVDVPTNVKLIEPTIKISEEEAKHLEKEFLLRQEKNQYYHLAYSQY